MQFIFPALTLGVAFFPKITSSIIPEQSTVPCNVMKSVTLLTGKKQENFETREIFLFLFNCFLKKPVINKIFIRDIANSLVFKIFPYML